MKRMTTIMALAALGVAPAVAHAQEEVRLSGREVAIYNLAGNAEVVRGSGSDVVVEVIRGGADGGRLTIDVGEIRGRETLRVIYPDNNIVYERMGRGSRNTLRVAPDGTFYGGRGRGGERVTISGGGGGLEAFADLRITVPAGRDFALYQGAGNAEVTGVVAAITLDLGSGRATVSDVEGNLNVDTGSGGVDVRGVQGDVLIDTGSGSVSVSGVRGSRLDVDTGSGRVEAWDIQVRRLGVDTGSGAVTLEEISAPEVFVDTGSGAVDVELTGDVDSIEIDTGSGGITLTLPADVGAEVTLDTSSGGIDVDLPVRVVEARRDYLEGVIGDGRGRIELDTGSGSIRLRAR